MNRKVLIDETFRRLKGFLQPSKGVFKNLNFIIPTGFGKPNFLVDLLTLIFYVKPKGVVKLRSEKRTVFIICDRNDIVEELKEKITNKMELKPIDITNFYKVKSQKMKIVIGKWDEFMLYTSEMNIPQPSQADAIIFYDIHRSKAIQIEKYTEISKYSFSVINIGSFESDTMNKIFDNPILNIKLSDLSLPFNLSLYNDITEKDLSDKTLFNNFFNNLEKVSDNFYKIYLNDTKERHVGMLRKLYANAKGSLDIINDLKVTADLPMYYDDIQKHSYRYAKSIISSFQRELKKIINLLNEAY